MRMIICGAAGRDFHQYLTLYREDSTVDVVAFTATQIPFIDQRRVPPAVAGPRYPDGIPIFDESELESLIRRLRVDTVAFAYSDVSDADVLALAGRVNAAGADFVLPGLASMLTSRRPVIGVGAVRTGCGKSQTVRWLLDDLDRRAVTAVGLRHPMPYDRDLASQLVQRFATQQDLEEGRCTIEEREEYEPYIERKRVVYAGVDYRSILEQAEREADLIIWDGGNNDLPFVRPDLYFVLMDPHRPLDAQRYYPSQAQVRLADVLLISKSRTASPSQVEQQRCIARELNPDAKVIAVASRLTLDGAEEASLRGKRVVCVEDGPTTTHGGMPYGAASLLAKRAGAHIIDPRSAFVGSLLEALRSYPDMGPLVPALGYSEAQQRDLVTTLAAIDADVILCGTPIDLAALVSDQRGRPVLRVRYDLEEIEGEPSLSAEVDAFLRRRLGTHEPGGES